MNTKAVNNFLYIPKQKDYMEEVYKLCMSKIRQGKLVVLFTKHRWENFLQFTQNTESPLSKDVLRYLLIMYFDDLGGISSKLLELHDWVLQPKLVIIDLNPYISTYADELQNPPASEGFGSKPQLLQSLCLCFASFYSFLDTVQNRLKAKQTGDTVCGVSLLQQQEPHLSRAQLELIINLYFYKQQAFDDFEELQCILRKCYDEAKTDM